MSQNIEDRRYDLGAKIVDETSRDQLKSFLDGNLLNQDFVAPLKQNYIVGDQGEALLVNSHYGDEHNTQHHAIVSGMEDQVRNQVDLMAQELDESRNYEQVWEDAVLKILQGQNTYNPAISSESFDESVNKILDGSLEDQGIYAWQAAANYLYHDVKESDIESKPVTRNGSSARGAYGAFQDELGQTAPAQKYEKINRKIEEVKDMKQRTDEKNSEWHQKLERKERQLLEERQELEEAIS